MNHLIVFAIIAGVFTAVAAGLWIMELLINRHDAKQPLALQPENDNGWTTVASWLESADGIRQPATPEATADFWRRWNTEVNASERNEQ